MSKKLTPSILLSEGDTLASWPCDVGGSNESTEHIVAYQKEFYSVIKSEDDKSSFVKLNLEELEEGYTHKIIKEYLSSLT